MRCCLDRLVKCFEEGIGIYGFAVSVFFFIVIFWCLLRFAVSVLFRCRFPVSAKLKSCFRICYSMHFGVTWFPVSRQKICASTTSTACMSSLILVEVYGFVQNLFRFFFFLRFFCSVLRFLIFSNVPLFFEYFPITFKLTKANVQHAKSRFVYLKGKSTAYTVFVALSLWSFQFRVNDDSSLHYMPQLLFN